jgi:DNA-directed RNA polymerase specialized sigma subunit
MVIAGLQAVMHLIEEGVEIKTVPVMVEDRHANEADRIFSQIVHNAGKPLTQLEQAKVFKRLVDLGWAQKDIALKAGISGGRVSQLLELLILPVILQKYIIEGKASQLQWSWLLTRSTSRTLTKPLWS